MTALQIALSGYLAFGQLTGNYYESIVKHSGLQVIHADGALTLRLREEKIGNGEQETGATDMIATGTPSEARQN